ncbi:hypothetical protein ACET3X_007759 [Alternaria dauci]|uniref:Zn(2)-C6 fungal-type domain-containing protein n=1 Tax=Alternaria dauci TaxID=48095 RepID=A0ABR3UED1_9PLEO
MIERVHQSTRDKRTHLDGTMSDDMKILNRAFSRAHAMSIHLNLIAIGATIWQFEASARLGTEPGGVKQLISGKETGKISDCGGALSVPGSVWHSPSFLTCIDLATSHRMEDTEQPSAARVGVLRTTQACQRCRNLKTRCLPSDQSGRCQRCFAAGKECAWAEAPRRTRKLRAPSRIAQVEQKIDGLVAKLVQAAAETELTPDSAAASQPTPNENRTETGRKQGTINVTPRIWMPKPSLETSALEHERNKEDVSESAEIDRQYLESIRSIHRFSDHEDVPQAPESFFRPSKRPEAPIEHEIVRQVLCSGEADILLNDYRNMSATFPFVMLPPQITAKQLHEHRPMLLLAVLLVSSWKDHTRQMQLDVVFRTELAHRTIVQPRRTLGLVQSVLVYLSWYHFVFSHKTEQIFFLHNIVIGLALDIGLHQDFQPISSSMPQRPKAPPPPPGELRERHRAFLGCYYLSSMVAAGLQKPNLLKHTPVMTEWAQGLKRNREYETDEAIDLLISLRQIDDQVQDALFTADASQLPISDGRALMHVRFIDVQLDAWKRECDGVASQELLELSFSYTKMQLHSVALRSSPPDLPASVRSSQINSLISSLEAGKQFLDALVSFPAQEYHLISFSEWMRLPAVIMTVTRLCIPTKEHVAIGWDTQAAQDRVRLDLCLESICYRMQTLSAFDKKKQPETDFWHVMRMIIDLTKNWYIRKIRPEQPSQTPSMPTPGSSIEHSASEGSCPITGAPRTHSTNHASDRYHNFADINYTDEFNMDLPSENEANSDPFGLMRSADFDMGQFFDMAGSIWGEDSYNSYAGMTFGSGAPF